jgi:hypothetical protein
VLVNSKVGRSRTGRRVLTFCGASNARVYVRALLRPNLSSEVFETKSVLAGG